MNISGGRHKGEGLKKVAMASLVALSIFVGSLALFSYASAQATGTATGTGLGAGAVTVTPAGGTNSVNALKDTTPDMAGGLVPCDGRSSDKCTWGSLVLLVNTFIKYIIGLTVSIAALMFSYAGILYLTNGASKEAQEKARGIFINVALGILIILGSVLIIKAILSALGVPGAYSSFF